MIKSTKIGWAGTCSTHKRQDVHMFGLKILKVENTWEA